MYSRQHASIQGEARFPGASPEPVYFKSELELLRLLRDWLERQTRGWYNMACGILLLEAHQYLARQPPKLRQSI